MPLDELKTFLKKEKHLPNVKSAKEVKDQGLNLSLSQMSLLRKVEELTLYTLKQQDEINLKEKTLNEQHSRISKLESMMKKLQKLISKD